MSRRSRSRLDKRRIAEALNHAGPEDEEDGEGDTPDTSDEMVTITGERIDLRKPWAGPWQQEDRR